MYCGHFILWVIITVSWLAKAYNPDEAKEIGGDSGSVKEAHKKLKQVNEN